MGAGASPGSADPGSPSTQDQALHAGSSALEGGAGGGGGSSGDEQESGVGIGSPPGEEGVQGGSSEQQGGAPFAYVNDPLNG